MQEMPRPGARNRSAALRKTAIDGHETELDLPKPRERRSEGMRIFNSENQMAKGPKEAGSSWRRRRRACGRADLTEPAPWKGGFRAGAGQGRRQVRGACRIAPGCIPVGA